MKTLGNLGFHALESPYSDFETSKVVIVPFRYAPNISKSENSPIEIIQASWDVSPFDESLMAAGGPVRGLSEMSDESISRLSTFLNDARASLTSQE